MKIKRDKLDALFSEFIRKRAIIRTGGCERCLTPKCDVIKEDGSIFPSYKQLQCSHFIGRGKQATRYDIDNGSGLCFGCHQYLSSHPLEHKDWFIAHLGKHKFNLLNSRVRLLDKIDRALIELYLEQKIKEVE